MNPNKPLEDKWRELADVPFDHAENGDLVLAFKWWLFDKGTEREEIWKYFDEHHSKGVHYLLYEFE